jgi:lipoprotein signal peptidase
MDRGRNRLLQLMTIVCLLVIADQVSKAMVREVLAPGDSVPFIDRVLQITFVQNYRGFSWWVPTPPLWVEWAFRVVLIAIVLVAFPVHTVYTQTRRPSIWADLAVVGITASSCGHLLDDLFAAYTIDFIQVFHSPSANLADVYSYIGIGGLAVETVLMLRIRQPKWRGFRHLWAAAVRTRNEFLQYVKRAIGF